MSSNPWTSQSSGSSGFLEATADPGAAARAFRERMLDYLGEPSDIRPVTTVAIESFVRDLLDRGAVPHSVLTLRLAQWARLDPDQQDLVVNVIDALQVAIDVADNVSDMEEDLHAGRRHYPTSLVPSLVCLPALIVGKVVADLHTKTPLGAPAAQRVLTVLSEMAVGQSRCGRDRIRRTSATQGLLLCLPLWISTHISPTECSVVERWAIALGETWQKLQLALELDTANTRSAYRGACSRLRQAWPMHYPFRRGDDLAIYTFGPIIAFS